MRLRQSTPATITLGPARDAATLDYVNTLTLAAADVALTKQDGGAAAKNDAGNPAYHADLGGSLGLVSLTLDATDTDTLGNLRVDVLTPSGFFIPPELFEVVPENVYDALVLGTGTLGPVASVSGAVAGTVGPALLQDDALTSAAIADGALVAAKFDPDVPEAFAGTLMLTNTETGLVFKELCQALFSAACAKLAGAGSTTVTARDKADTKNRLTVTTDFAGNRSAVVYSFDV